MIRVGLLALALAACGRVGFDAPTGDGGVGDAPPTDARADDGIPSAFAPTTIEEVAEINVTGATVKLAADPTHLYISISTTGEIQRRPHTGGPLAPFLSGIAMPGGLALGNGRIWISARGTAQVVTRLVVGGATSQIGSGTRGHVDGGPALAQFDVPAGLCSDGAYIYVADRGASCSIRRIDATTLIVDTIAGTPGTCEIVDGAAGANRIENPGGCLAFDNHLYFSDSSTVRRLSLATRAVETIAGEGIGYVEGSGVDARFSMSVAELATDGVRVFAADSYNFRVRTLERIAPFTVGTLVGDGIDTDVFGAIVDASIHEPDGLAYVPGIGLYVASDRTLSLVH